MNIPDYFSESLETDVRVVLKLFDAYQDTGSGIVLTMDPRWKNPDPGSARLVARTCEDPRGRDIGIDPLQHLLQLDIRILADNGALRAQVGQTLHGHGRHQADNTRHVHLRHACIANP
jgi:hypothetical protein